MTIRTDRFSPHRYRYRKKGEFSFHFATTTIPERRQGQLNLSSIVAKLPINTAWFIHLGRYFFQNSKVFL